MGRRFLLRQPGINRRRRPQTNLRRSFLPGAKDERSPLKRGGFSCFGGTPNPEGTGVGTGDGGGVLKESGPSM